MTEKYVILNTGVGDKRGPCSFNVYKNIDKTDGMNVCNYKRALRSAAINVNIANACSKDLVKVTGLSIAELKDQSELTKLIGQRIIQVMEDSSKVIETKPIEEKLIEVPLVEEDPDMEVPEGMVAVDLVVGEEPVEETVTEEPVIDQPVEELAKEPVEAPAEAPAEEEMPVEKRHRGRPAKKN
jgi:hypothetical protein